MNRLIRNSSPLPPPTTRLSINGGVQNTPSGTVNTGRHCELSFQAIYALVRTAGTANEFHCSTRGSEAFKRLCESTFHPELETARMIRQAGQVMMCFGIPFVIHENVSDDTIEAWEVSKLTGARRRLAELTGIARPA